jgi:transcription-repair coupling factor (superfamily II helicase)
MEKKFKMDRLLCGDVGFGKTEVAARAVFKCVADSKQVAILVPTTILANQHYHTLKERFEKFPFTTEMLSRFRTEKEQTEIIKKLKAGTIDVIIGTHRLLSEDIAFKDLGLLIIDEEQKFGVKHKEKIKALKENVDILALSATPIPRTLHMSLTGIRDMSLIEEPPEERYPVQTYVLEQEDKVMKEAIERELGRNGQVFVVYNKVQGIYRIASKIAGLVPEANVAVGHGQMNENALEDVMLKFVNGDTNVLVSTTIIESGIDIPNVNTMIILNCDRFGLSQLYQLRGRVGRSNRMAYAYLMYQKDKILTEAAEKRLKTIKSFTEFGSGFKIAMKDLEIRGAGNLLGMEQHGHMMMIGYELYCKLVDDAVRALGGEVVNPDKEESAIEFEISAYISENYIAEETLRLQMYKKIASIVSKDDESEIIDELLDRFGEIPKEAHDLIKISRIRAMAEKAFIARIHERAGKIIFDFAPSNRLNAKIWAELAEKYGRNVFIHGGTKPYISLAYGRQAGKLDQTLAFLELF